MENLGLKELRNAVGLTAEQLGNKVGKSSSYILRIESGNVANPSYETMINIAYAISETDAIQNNDIDLFKFETPLAKTIIGLRMDSKNEAYRYSMENKGIEEQVELMKALTDSDMNTLKALIKFRQGEQGWNNATNNLKKAILKHSNEKEYKNIVEMLYINNEIKISEIINEKYEFVTRYLEYEIQDLAVKIDKYGYDMFVIDKYDSDYISNKTLKDEIEAENEFVIPEVEE
ncbi:helix-turn-helix transcriptional regulator [Clostridium tertium]|uniref:helix-turn-helix domain-containing protein n=1 Tax=Clostridium tertium TaxID=1559 RepID=UPI00325A7322